MSTLGGHIFIVSKGKNNTCGGCPKHSADILPPPVQIVDVAVTKVSRGVTDFAVGNRAESWTIGVVQVDWRILRKGRWGDDRVNLSGWDRCIV